MHFVGVKEKKTQTPWAHIDMAGPVWEYTNNKPTGFGVQLLVDYIQQVNNNSQQWLKQNENECEVWFTVVYD